MVSGPGRPANSLPTASHLLGVLEKYEKETDIVSEELTLAEIKQRLSVKIVLDELQKKEKNKKSVQDWRTKNVK